MKKFLGIFFALALAVALAPVGVHAMAISPPFFDLSVPAIEPGAAYMETINLYNELDTPVTLYVSSTNFTSKGDESGGPEFYSADEYPFGTAMAEWVSFDTKPIVMEPQSRFSLPITVNVPLNAQPGSHFGAVIFGTAPPDEQAGAVAVNPEVGVLLLVRVAGEVHEQANIAEFGFTDPQVWYNRLPVGFFVRFENTGNAHLRPTGNLFIHDFLGRQVATIPVNADFRTALPLSIRRFEFGWIKSEVKDSDNALVKEWKNFALGKYTATLVLSYGQETNKIISDSRVFYVWPWRLMSVVGGGFLVLILLLVGWLKLYKRAIIKRYQKQQAKK